MRQLFMVASLVALGCGGTFIDAKTYSQKCTQDADCAPAYVGDACAVCTCSNAAIATSSKAKYDADVAAMRARCGPQPAVACGPCNTVTAKCSNGTCGL
jgi:hypothetical protein